MNLSCSSPIAQMMLEGMQEIVGEGDMQSFVHQSQVPAERQDLHAASPVFTDLCELQKAVERRYGPMAGRGILWRSGRASFKHLLPEFWKRLGMSNLQFRLLPSAARIKAGLRALSAVLAGIYGEEIQTVDDGDVWTWNMKHCPLCAKQRNPGPACDFSVGLLEEFLSWATSGRWYVVEEYECLAAAGAACRIKIQKKPLN